MIAKTIFLPLFSKHHFLFIAFMKAKGKFDTINNKSANAKLIKSHEIAFLQVSYLK